MKHSETLTLRKMKVKTSQMEAWNTQKLSPSGNETFSSGSMKRSEILTPRKMDMNNSQMETWEILTLRKMKMKILTLRCMLCVVQEKKQPTNILKSFTRGCTYVFFNVWCCVLCTRKQICLIHNKGYTFSNVCCFFPNVWLCVVRMRKTRGIKWTSGCFSKGSMTWCQLLIFLKQKHVQFTINKWTSSKQKQEQCSFVNVFDGLRGFLNEKSLWYFAFWNSLTPSEKFWFFVDPFSQKKIVVSWFIDYCSLPVLASKKWTCMWNTTAWILDNCKLVHA